MNTDILFGFRLMQKGEPKAPVLEAKLGGGKGGIGKAPPSKPTASARAGRVATKVRREIG